MRRAPVRGPPPTPRSAPRQALWKKAARVYQAGTVMVDLARNRREIVCDAYPDVPLESDALPDAAAPDAAEAAALVRERRGTRTAADERDDEDEAYFAGFTEDDEAPCAPARPPSFFLSPRRAPSRLTGAPGAAQPGAPGEGR